MKFILMSILWMSGLACTLSAQTTNPRYFCYDAAGNRLWRTSFQDTNCDGIQSIVNDDKKWDEESYLYAKHIKVYPNPGPGMYKIHNDSIGEKDEYVIYTMDGQMIYSVPALSTDQNIDISGHPDGMYILTYKRKDAKLLTWPLIKNQ